MYPLYVVRMGTGEKIAEVRVNPRAVYVAALAVGIPLTLLFMALADVLAPARRDSGILSLLVALALFLPLVWVHELLHALAALVCGRLHPRDLQIRVLWKYAALMCYIRTPIRVSTARVVGLTPLVVTGPLMVGFLLIYPRQMTALLAGMTILGCVMDVVMVWKLRRFDGDLLVVDHPSEPRFAIYAPDDCVPDLNRAGTA